MDRKLIEETSQELEKLQNHLEFLINMAENNCDGDDFFDNFYNRLCGDSGFISTCAKARKLINDMED